MSQDRIASASDLLRARLDGGLIPAVPVPFHSDGRLHAGAHEAYLRYMAEQPIAGVAVWAHTGRGLMLTDETARLVLQGWRSALPHHVVIAGAGSPAQTLTPAQATARSIDVAERAARYGADCLLVYAPAWLRGHHNMDALIVEHHRQLAEVGLPLILFYLYEAAGGISYSPAVLDELLAMPQVVGIKMVTLNSIMTYQDVARHLAARHPEKLLITGEDRFLGYSLRRGGRSALVGMGAVCCRLQAELIDCHLKGEAARFLALSDQADFLAEAIFIAPMEGYITRLLWALAHLGVIPEAAANDPWGTKLPTSDFVRLARTLDALEQARLSQ